MMRRRTARSCCVMARLHDDPFAGIANGWHGAHGSVGPRHFDRRTRTREVSCSGTARLNALACFIAANSDPQPILIARP